MHSANFPNNTGYPKTKNTRSRPKNALENERKREKDGRNGTRKGLRASGGVNSRISSNSLNKRTSFDEDVTGQNLIRPPKTTTDKVLSLSINWVMQYDNCWWNTCNFDIYS